MTKNVDSENSTKLKTMLINTVEQNKNLEFASFQECFQWATDLFIENNIEEAHREVYLILSLVQNKDLAYIIANLKEDLPESFDSKLFINWIRRRAQNEPLAYIVGEKEFFGRSFIVGPGALIPRPETEHLIEWVIEDHSKEAFQRGIDLCTGTGIIGITLNQELNLPFEMLDISTEALEYTQKNIQKHTELKIKGIQHDITQPYPDYLGNFDLITINPPYIPESEYQNLDYNVKKYEPKKALWGGPESGLEMVEKSLAQLKRIASENCSLYIELGYGQKGIIDTINLSDWKIEGWRNDLAGIPRILKLSL